MPNIIGISSFFHDSACCLIRDRELVAAAQEERFSRRKHDSGLPKSAFRYCLRECNLTVADIDCMAYYEDPALKLQRQICMQLPHLSEQKALQLWRGARRPEREIRNVLGYQGPILYISHHESHAASSFFFSGFDEAAILTVDGVGEWATTTFGWGHDSTIHIDEEVHFPDSIGLLYSAITNYLGFAVNDGEYKVMGLAPYGEPTHVGQVWKLLANGNNAKYELDLQYFDFNSTEHMYTEALPVLFGQPPRIRGSEINRFHKDLARSLQVVIEEVLLQKVFYLHTKTNLSNLCMAGGVALNCVANGRIRREGPFKRVFVQPAAGDAGTSLGAAAMAHIHLTGQRPSRDPMRHVFLGPGFSSKDIKDMLGSMPVRASEFLGREEELIDVVVDRLVTGDVIAWFSGRMEFGPRSLGGRCILADPRIPDIRDRINSKIKQRESFRPFAPAVMADHVTEHFAMNHDSPFMLETCDVTSKLRLPAITHVDGSARVQTVDQRSNPRFYKLLQAFWRRTGCPLLLNTSLNMQDEPIVCTPVDALLCFTRSEIDALVLQDFIIDRKGLGTYWEKLVRRARPNPHVRVTEKVYKMS